MPTMLLQEGKLARFDQRINEVVEGATDLSGVYGVLTDLVQLQMETRPNFHKKRLAIMEAACVEKLKVLDEVEQNAKVISMEDFGCYEKIISSLMQIFPEASEYPRRHKQCTKLKQVVGTWNLKKDVVGKGNALEQDMQSNQKYSEFCALASLMPGVDISDNKSEVCACSSKVLQRVQTGALNDCEEAFVEGLLDAYETVATAAQATKEANTLQLKKKELKADWAYNKVRKMGPTPKDILANSASSEAIEQLRVKTNELRSTRISLDKADGLLKDYTTDGIHEKCQGFLTELAKHEMALADDKLQKTAKELQPRTGVDANSYKIKWSTGIKDFATLAKAAETHLSPEASLTKLATDFNEALHLVISLIICLHWALRISNENNGFLF